MIASGYLRSLRLLENLDAIPATPNAMDDEFNDGSFDTGKWTWMDQGAASISETGDRVTVSLTESSNRIRGFYQSTPAGDWGFRAKIHYPLGSGQAHSALFVAESTTGDVRTIGYWGDTHSIFPLSYTTPSSGAVGDGTQKLLVPEPPWFYAELQWDDTNDYLHGRVSFNGLVWYQVRTGTSALAYTPALVGLGFSNLNNTATIYPFGWFRRIA
jgi:hypothetical protein